MKTFKKFSLDEATFQTTIASLNQDIPTGNYSDPRVVKALNSFVGTVARATMDGTMIPEMVVSRLRNSLSKIGLTFGEVPMMEGASGSFELPLTSFGGRFGKGVNKEIQRRRCEGVKINNHGLRGINGRVLREHRFHRGNHRRHFVGVLIPYTDSFFNTTIQHSRGVFEGNLRKGGIGNI